MNVKEKRVINQLLNDLEELLSNMADAGDYEDADGNPRSDVNALEKDISKVLLLLREGN